MSQGTFFDILIRLEALERIFVFRPKIDFLPRFWVKNDQNLKSPKSHICFLFNLNHNVMMMCEWQQLVYLVIYIASKATKSPDFWCLSAFV